MVAVAVYTDLAFTILERVRLGDHLEVLQLVFTSNGVPFGQIILEGSQLVIGRREMEENGQASRMSVSINNHCFQHYECTSSCFSS